MLVLAVSQFELATADEGQRGSNDNPRERTKSQSQLFQDIETSLIEEGCRTVRLEHSDGMVESKGFEQDGACVDVYFDRKSIEELFREPDHCDRYSGDYRRASPGPVRLPARLHRRHLRNRAEYLYSLKKPACSPRPRGVDPDTLRPQAERVLVIAHDKCTIGAGMIICGE